MAQTVWSLMAIVVIAALCVRVVALMSGAAELRLLPVHRRSRVQWCASHFQQVEVAGAGLLAVLAILQFSFAVS